MGAKSDTIMWKSLGSDQVRLFVFLCKLQTDPMRRATQLIDLNDCVGRFSFGIHVSAITCKWWSSGSHRAHTGTELDDQKLFSRGMASIKSTASYISLTFLFL